MAKYTKTFKQVKAYARSLDINTTQEWREWAITCPPLPQYITKDGRSLPYRPDWVPVNPKSSFTRRQEWTSWVDFLGIKPKKPKYLPYDQAKKKVHKLKIKSLAGWIKWHTKHKPHNIPKYEDHYISAGTWVNWSDFLGTWSINSVIRNQFMLDYMGARAVVHKMHFEKRVEYTNWWKATRPYTLPVDPTTVYAKQWGGLPDFLGTSVYSRMQLVMSSISVFYIAYYNYYPTNVFKIRVEPKGQATAEEQVTSTNGNIVRLYQYDANQHEMLTSILRNHCTSWWDGYSNEYVVQNIYMLFNDLDIVFQHIPSNNVTY
jgi:hypothetical protein